MKKKTKRDTFIYEDLGFPIKFLNVPMSKVSGKWYMDINLNQVMEIVFQALIRKPSLLSGGEIRFIRTYMGMTTTEFGKQFGYSHPAVLKWESGKGKISPALDAYLKLFMLDYLKANNENFRLFFNRLKEWMLSKKEENKKPLEIDIDELKTAV